jgi:hypothetical protein
MASAELAVVRDEPAAVAQRDIVDGWVEKAASVFKLADHICDTDFVPDAYRGNAPAVAAAILAGRELGIGPMTSLRHVQIVKGNPSLSAEYKRARVLAAGHEFTILEINTQRCRVKGKRRGSSEPPLEIKFDMADAKTAGLLNPSRSGKPGAWQTRPRRMLFARAASELCDLMFSDVVNGLATTDLLAEGTDEDALAGYDEPNGQEPNGQESPKPAAGKARRKTAAAGDDTRNQRHTPRPRDGADEHGTDPAPRAAGAAPSPGAQPLPPLPGEDEVPTSGAAATSATDPANGGSSSATSTDLEPGEAAEYGTERHKKVVGIVWAHLQRLGYPDDSKESDEEKAARLADVAKLAGVSEIGSTNDLDLGELSQVADTLARCKNRAALDALLKAGEVGE